MMIKPLMKSKYFFEKLRKDSLSEAVAYIQKIINSEIKMSAVSVCKYYKHGFCKYGDRCRYQHNHTVCEDENCSTLQCAFRHPKPCRFYQIYGRCKFGEFCQFKHVGFISQEERKFDLEKLLEKISEILNRKLTDVLQNFNLGIAKVDDIYSKMEKLSNSVNNPHVQTSQIFHVALLSNYTNKEPKVLPSKPFTLAQTDEKPTQVSVPLHQPSTPFQTRPENSCCSHLCRNDMLNDPEYDKCCLHRCRVPWT